ncbi:MAG: tetratricopeptide repeat protein [Deltaproteobacteria bacterium]|nr:tetratricopeptide repeat protein [Deltaproteobacteria bacterium]
MKNFLTWLWSFPVIACAIAFLFSSPLSQDFLLSITLGEKLVTGSFRTITADWYGWISSVTLFLIYKLSSEALRLVALAITMGLVALIWRHTMRRTSNWSYSLVVLTLAYLCLRETLTLGPGLFTQLVAGLITLEWADHSFNSKKHYAWILLAACLWSNLAEAPIYIICICTIHSLCFGRSINRAWIFPAAAAGAGCLNPYGYKIYVYTIQTWSYGIQSQWEGWKSWFPIVPQGKGLSIELTASAVTILIVLFNVLLSIRPILKRSLSRRESYTLVCSLITTIPALVAVSWKGYLFIPCTLVCTSMWPQLVTAFKKSPMRPALGRAAIILGSCALLWHGNGMRSRLPAPVPRKAVEFLKNSDLQGSVFNKIAWAGFLAHSLPGIRVELDSRVWLYRNIAELFIGKSDQAGVLDLGKMLNVLSDIDIIIYDSMTAPRPKLEENWLLVYDNNVATIAIRKSQRNKQNIEKVQAYYKSRNIPFDTDIGLNLRKAYRASPHWVLSQEENAELGLLPEKWIPTFKTIQSANFFLSRNLAPLAVERLKNALEDNPEDEELSLRLGEILLVAGRYFELKSWIKYLEKTDLPSDKIAPLRFGLYMKDREQYSGAAPETDS